MWTAVRLHQSLPYALLLTISTYLRTSSPCSAPRTPRYVQARLPPAAASRCHFFNAFFLRKLREEQQQHQRVSAKQAALADFERVKKWTKVGTGSVALTIPIVAAQKAVLLEGRGT